MAVVDKYSNANVEADKLEAAVEVSGAKTLTLVAKVSIAAGDDDGSVYRIGAGLDPELIPTKIDIYTAGIQAGTDFDLGFYKPNGGAVVDKDALADGLDLSSAKTRSSPADGLTTVDTSNINQRIFELAGHSAGTKLPRYDLALTGNTVGTSAAVVTFLCDFVQG